ncbi:acetyltransferase domain-containing protein [Xylaria sp. CBS 124048]|nr:acetyltransferase domain-containing protein [Xylaria sp. CBS 124048]
MAPTKIPEAPATAPKIKVKTTWPTLPERSARTPIRTKRLLLRLFEASDAEAIYELRKQPEVMIWTPTGTADQSIEHSRAFLEHLLPPKDFDKYTWIITYSENSGEAIIGFGGTTRVRHEAGWPEIGFLFRKEYWGLGLATEFLRGFLEAWWALPRSEIELEVEPDSIGKRKEEDGVIRVPEVLLGMTMEGNMGSRRVLEKSGFIEFKRWTQPDTRTGYEGKDVTLLRFRLEVPGKLNGQADNV